MRCSNRYFLILYFFSFFGLAQQDKKLDSLIALYTKAVSDTDRINKYSDIGAYVSGIGKPAEAITYYEKIVKAFSKKYPLKGIDSKNKIAFNYILLEEYEKADSLVKQIIEESTKLNYLKGIGLANRNLGLVNTYQGNYKDAVTYYLKALKIWESTKNMKLISTGYSDLGIVFYFQENYEKAIYYWENCIKINPDKGADEQMNNLSNLGQAYVGLGNYDKASMYLRKVLHHYEKNKKSGQYINALTGLANVEFKRKGYTQALIYYTEIIKLREENNGRNNDLAIAYLNVSLIYGEFNKPKEALEYGLKGYERAKESGDKNELLHAYNNLNTAYAKAENYEKAYEFSQLYTGLKDSLSNVESQKQINELDKQYQTEKKEKENQLLSKQVEIHEIKSKQQDLYLLISIVIVVLVAVVALFLFNQNKNKQRTNLKLAVKNKIIEEQHKDIIDSINYAKRIQQAVLNEEDHVSQHLPPHFIFFKPKDIVSGDFYWALEKGDYLYVAAADCTGHGVPGAFLTMLGISYLNELNSKDEIFNPAEILNQLRDKIVKELSRHGTTKDGMDISMIRMNLKTKEIMWAGAFNPLWYTENGVLKQIKANKQPIGYAEDIAPFTNHILPTLKADDSLYLFTDGLADQFGGPKGKKYKYKQLEEVLMANRSKAYTEQKSLLLNSFDKWIGNLEQVDDVTVIAIQVT